MVSQNINGLWEIEFLGPIGTEGTGLVVFREGDIRGGDSSYIYIGQYTISNTNLTANVKIQHYRGPMNNIFGPRSLVELILEAIISDQLIIGSGYDKAYLSQRMSFKMRKLND